MTNNEKKEAISAINKLERDHDKATRFKKRFIQYVWITIGVCLTTLGFYFFFEPAKIVAGGVTGITIILEPLWEGTKFQSSYFLYGIEIFTLFLGLIFIGKDFFIKTIYASLLSPSIVFLFEICKVNPNLIYDDISNENKMFISLLMGALLTGMGVGLALRNDGSTGGMDVIQKIISKYARIPLSQTMYVTDWVVVIIAGLTFNPIHYSVEKVVYGSLAVIAEGYIIDYLALSLRPRRTVYVISDRPQEVKNLIYNELNRGVTFSPVQGAYTNKDRTMVICTMDKNEAYRIVGMISDLDPRAFTFVTSCKEVRGEYTRRGLF